MNKRFRHIVAIISTLWALVLASMATPLLAQSAPDWPVSAGRFYTQASGVPDSQLGFAITNGDDVPLWDEYQRWGGPDALGYPITNRFRQDGFWVQATEQFLLQWNPQAKRVDFVNVMDRLSEEGHDTFLFLARQIPEPDAWPEEAGLTAWEIVQNRLSVLADNPDISAAYWSASLAHWWRSACRQAAWWTRVPWWPCEPSGPSCSYGKSRRLGHRRAK